MIEWIKEQMSCEKRWHKWQPVFISATYNLTDVKFIACRCDRCWKGWDEIHNIIDVWTNKKYWTFSEEYFI